MGRPYKCFKMVCYSELIKKIKIKGKSIKIHYLNINKPDKKVIGKIDLGNYMINRASPKKGHPLSKTSSLPFCKRPTSNVDTHHIKVCCCKADRH